MTMSRQFSRGRYLLARRAIEVGILVVVATLGACSSAAFASSATSSSTSMRKMTSASSSSKGPNHGASTAPSAALTLMVAAQSRDPSELTLTAQLRGSGDPGGKSVAFFVVTREFMQPEYLPIGTATTTAGGAASVSYRPTWSGKEQFVAKLTGSGAQPLSATAYFHVTASAPGPLAATANPKRPLAFVGHVFLTTVLTIVGAIWLTLIVILLLVSRRLPHLAGLGRRAR